MGKTKARSVEGFIEDSLSLIKVAEKYTALSQGSAKASSLLLPHDRLFTSPRGYRLAYSCQDITVPLFGDGNGQLAAAWRYRLEKAAGESISGSRERFTAIQTGLECIKTGDFTGLRTVLAQDFQAEHRNRIINSIGREESWELSVRNGEKQLYFSGVPVSENDRVFFRHLMGLDRFKANRIADAVVRGYIQSFHDDRKSLKGKSTVALNLTPGYSPLACVLQEKFREHGLRLDLAQFRPTDESVQASIDHRFDWVLFLNQESARQTLESLEDDLKKNQTRIASFSGTVHLLSFGKRQPEPVNSELSPVPTSEQNDLYREFLQERQELINRYIRRDEISYTGIAFPMPDAGKSFIELFDDMIEVNTLEAALYQSIQNTLIETLDKAESIQIKGVEGNETQLRIQMNSLSDFSRETNFLNCLATINIPLGEVFTSPVLKGTTGRLHIQEIYLEGILFKDLILEFRNGYITAYSCGNTDDENRNRELVHSSLIHPHETLPVGEFAIGTNTAAYGMAQRHGIMNLLPVLVVEKMGPHIAIGDTCFRDREDVACYNPDGREMVARSNEKTRLRKIHPEKAYTSTHKDITLPYHSIGTLSAIHSDGTETLIISNGRFTLPGTEHLNMYLD